MALHKLLVLSPAAIRYNPEYNSYPPATQADTYQTRSYVLGAPYGQQGATWIKLWVSWYYLQQAYTPTSVYDSWDHLNTSASANGSFPQMRWLDEQIAQANADGLGVILGVDATSPLWANCSFNGHVHDPYQYYDVNGNLHPLRPDYYAFPYNVTTDTIASVQGHAEPAYWAWFIEYLICRYSWRKAYNPTGPTQSNPFGNTQRAWVNAIEICNEPNYLNWPQETISLEGTVIGPSACTVATMIQTAAAVSDFIGGMSLLAPAVADGLPTDSDGWRFQGQAGVGYHDFTQTVLNLLPGFKPARTYVGWSHHNYHDIGNGTTRAQDVANILGASQWNGPGGDKSTWITEGGASDANGSQGSKIQGAWSVAPSGAYTFGNYFINDDPAGDTPAALRGPASMTGPGPDRSGATVWNQLTSPAPSASP